MESIALHWLPNGPTTVYEGGLEIGAHSISVDGLVIAERVRPSTWPGWQITVGQHKHQIYDGFKVEPVTLDDNEAVWPLADDHPVPHPACSRCDGSGFEPADLPDWAEEVQRDLNEELGS